MARIAGINIPDNKHVIIALTSIYGIGRSLSGKICGELNIDPQTKVNSLTEEQIELLRNHVVKYNICLLYTSPSPRDRVLSRMPSSA